MVHEELLYHVIFLSDSLESAGIGAHVLERLQFCGADQISKIQVEHPELSDHFHCSAGNVVVPLLKLLPVHL